MSLTGLFFSKECDKKQMQANGLRLINDDNHNLDKNNLECFIKLCFLFQSNKRKKST